MSSLKILTTSIAWPVWCIISFSRIYVVFEFKQIRHDYPRLPLPSTTIFSQSFNKTIVWPRRESILHCIVLNKWNNSCQNSRSIWTTLSVTWWFLGCPAQCQELDWWVPASSAYSVIVSKRPNNLTSMNHQWCVEKAILLTFLCFPPLFNK